MTEMVRCKQPAAAPLDDWPNEHPVQELSAICAVQLAEIERLRVMLEQQAGDLKRERGHSAVISGLLRSVRDERNEAQRISGGLVQSLATLTLDLTELRAKLRATSRQCSAHETCSGLECPLIEPHAAGSHVGCGLVGMCWYYEGEDVGCVEVTE